MPELPDLTIYIEHLHRRVTGARLLDIRLRSPFVLRSVSPSPEDVRGRLVRGVRRLAKQMVFDLEDNSHGTGAAGERERRGGVAPWATSGDGPQAEPKAPAVGHCFMVIHLMIAGRLRWYETGKAPPRAGLAAFDFSSGTLLLTEASKKKRASLRLVSERDAMAALDPGGLELLDIDEAAFVERLRASNHTLKRTLTDQRIFAGVGNAYSDEILLAAGLSPFKRARDLDDDEAARLFEACRTTLTNWIDILRAKAGESFPRKVTAFHAEMSAHGKYRQPCPVCGAPIQRIVYAENESNYCARCQTGGRVLADRSLSRLLKESYPKRI